MQPAFFRGFLYCEVCSKNAMLDWLPKLSAALLPQKSSERLPGLARQLSRTILNDMHAGLSIKRACWGPGEDFGEALQLFVDLRAQVVHFAEILRSRGHRQVADYLAREMSGAGDGQLHGRVWVFLGELALLSALCVSCFLEQCAQAGNGPAFLDRVLKELSLPVRAPRLSASSDISGRGQICGDWREADMNRY